MTNWLIDFESCTASHPAGWVFQFSRADDDELGGGWQGECIAMPDSPDLNMVARMAREAGEAYHAALKKRH